MYLKLMKGDGRADSDPSANYTIIPVLEVTFEHQPIEQWRADQPKRPGDETPVAVDHEEQRRISADRDRAIVKIAIYTTPDGGKVTQRLYGNAYVLSEKGHTISSSAAY